MGILASERWVIPARVEASERQGAFAFWSADTKVAVKVTATESVVVEACLSSNSLADVTLRTARVFCLAPEEVQPGVRRVVDRLIELGFLAKEGSEAPKVLLAPMSAVRPLTLYLHLTAKCNLRCVYCYNGAHRAEVRGERPLTLEEYRALLERAASAGVRTVVFTGGEALLRRDWKAIAEHACALNLGTALLTNGILITPDNAPDIARLFHSVTISLDSHQAEINDRQRGEGSFDRIMAGVRALRTTGYKNLVLRPVLTRNNLSTLPDFPAFAAQRCGTTRFSPIVYIPNSLQEEQTLGLAPDPLQLDEAIARFTNELKAVGGEIADRIGPMLERSRCGAGGMTLSIDFNGDIYPCQAFHTSDMRLGNIRDADLVEVAEASSVGRALRSLRVDDVEVCSECGFMTLCGGGCRAIAWKLHGRLNAFCPELCKVHRDYVWDTIWAQLEGKATRQVAGTCA